MGKFATNLAKGGHQQCKSLLRTLGQIQLAMRKISGV